MGPKVVNTDGYSGAVGQEDGVYGHTYRKSVDQPGKVASPARGQLNRKNEYFPVRVRVGQRIVWREVFRA